MKAKFANIPFPRCSCWERIKDHYKKNENLK